MRLVRDDDVHLMAEEDVCLGVLPREPDDPRVTQTPARQRADAEERRPPPMSAPSVAAGVRGGLVGMQTLQVHTSTWGVGDLAFHRRDGSRRSRRTVAIPQDQARSVRNDYALRRLSP
jgi:hypothetical protein